MDIYMGSFFRVKNNDCYEERKIKGLKTYYTISFRFIVYFQNIYRKVKYKHNIERICARQIS